MFSTRAQRPFLLHLTMGLCLVSGCLMTLSAQAQPRHGEPRMGWQQLTPAEQAALQPLAGQWSSLPADQQRKWRGMAAQYPQLSPGEQQRMQERMSQWTRMSHEQRQQARRNFDAARSGTSPQERRARWEAYQNLPESQRGNRPPQPQAEANRSHRMSQPGPRMAEPQRRRAEPDAHER